MISWGYSNINTCWVYYFVSLGFEGHWDKLQPIIVHNKVKIANFPFWDTNTLHPKKEIPYIGPSLAHNSTVLDDLTIYGCFSELFEAD
jgi:hypothetical protein